MSKNNFSFGTKAETLNNLKKCLKHSTIPSLYVFTIKDWYDNKGFVLQKIANLFQGENVAVRSSAWDEDKADQSMAGAYYTSLNILSSDKENLENSQKMKRYAMRILNLVTMIKQQDFFGNQYH